MKVIIDQEVFQPDVTPPLMLLALLRAGSDERHAILLRPSFREGDSAPISRWCADLPEGLQREIGQVLTQGPDLAAGLSADVSTLRVQAREESDWRGAKVTPEDALRLLTRPLRLLMENSRNDLAFLLAMLREAHRNELLKYFEKGWVEPQMAGGLGELKAFLEGLRDPKSARAWITLAGLWVLFDRDSDPSDRRSPSQQSEEVRALCEGLKTPWPLRHWQLHRRAIENYVPRQALTAWVTLASRAERLRRLPIVQAFASTEMTPEMRRYFNMKRGFLGDASADLRRQIRQEKRNLRPEEVDPAFRGLEQDTVTALQGGFGADIGALFHDLDLIKEEDMARELQKSQWPELAMDDLYQSIVDRM